MPRPRNALNVTEPERQRIRELFAAGVHVAEIARRVGRGEAVVYRTVRGMKRPRPAPRPSPRIARRNELIVRRAVDEVVPQIEVARRFSLSPTMVCQIVREALGLRAKRLAITRRSGSGPEAPQPVGAPTRAERPQLTRAQRTRRNGEIVRLVLGAGVTKAAVARRYQLSVSQVTRIVEQARGRSR